MREIPLILLGLGKVGRAVVGLLEQNDGYDAEGVRLTLQAVFDSRGGVRATGIAAESLLELKRRGGSVVDLAGAERLGAAGALDEAPGAILVDCSPTDAENGGPGLDAARLALVAGHSVVFASKGPLVAAHAELSDLARRHGGRLGASAAVGIPLPSLEVALAATRGASLRSMRGALNGASDRVLAARLAGRSRDEAVAEARELGILEADPRLDLEGWDAAYKILILARVAWDPALPLSAIRVAGVEVVTDRELAAIRSEGGRVRLVATASRDREGEVRMAVRPERLAPDDPLFALGPGEKGLVLDTGSMGRISLAADGGGPVVTAACVLKDVLNLAAPRAL